MEKESRKESKKAKHVRSSGTATPPTTTDVVTPSGGRKRVIAENGKILIVDAIGNVFLEEETEDGEKLEFLLDIDEIQRPTIRDTVLFQLPSWLFHKSIGRLIRSSRPGDHPDRHSEEPADPGSVTMTEDNDKAAATSSGAVPKRKAKRGEQRS